MENHKMHFLFKVGVNLDENVEAPLPFPSLASQKEVGGKA